MNTMICGQLLAKRVGDVDEGRLRISDKAIRHHNLGSRVAAGEPRFPCRSSPTIRCGLVVASRKRSLLAAKTSS